MGASKGDTSLLERLLHSDDRWVSLGRDLVWVVGVVGLIALALYLVSGTWPAVVTIESESMVPNMNVGDLVFVVAPDRFGNLTTSAEGAATGVGRFNTYPDRAGSAVWGDVIIYRPNGNINVHPIIHRAIDHVNDSAAAAEFGAEHGGYVTKGDHNAIRDQDGGYIGLGRLEPVKPEWVIGKAVLVVPLVGYLPLHLIEVALVLIGLTIVYELWLSRREKAKAPPPRGKGRRK
ncbi:MAG TPA: S26 family signal peptidase [Methanoregulaceae archaeon]|nr:S26 family signal peptidase [Methanoregulaceae archaeon]HOV68456.1 S26 family signal peptidase [Methanoregulaceae archaeon]HQJ88138.1 S26 family signal peptidase [Methanoregulaceae archaeon]